MQFLFIENANFRRVLEYLCSHNMNDHTLKLPSTCPAPPQTINHDGLFPPKHSLPKPHNMQIDNHTIQREQNGYTRLATFVWYGDATSSALPTPNFSSDDRSCACLRARPQGRWNDEWLLRLVTQLVRPHALRALLRYRELPPRAGAGASGACSVEPC